MRDKWKDYSGKFRDFTECIFNMRPSEEELQSRLGLEDRPQGFLAFDKNQQSIRKKFTYRVQVKPPRVNPGMGKLKGGTGDLLDKYTETKCYPYTKVACARLFHGEVQARADGCIFSLNPGAYKEGDALDAHDEYWLKEKLKQRG